MQAKIAVTGSKIRKQPPTRPADERREAREFRISIFEFRAF
jgi:hypothetical protein